MGKDTEGMSQLEHEFEQEYDKELEDHEFELEDHELEDHELEHEFELELEDHEFEDSELEDHELEDHEFELEDHELEDHELEHEFELELEDHEFEDSELEDHELEDHESSNERVSFYADKFYELSEKSFESSFELDREINGLMNEMERDFFFKKLFKKVRKPFTNLIKQGISMATRRLPVLSLVKGVTQLARGNLKGALSNLAKSGLAAGLTAIPGGAAALPVLGALNVGFEAPGDSEEKRKAWYNFVDISRESFNYLARNLNEKSKNPIEANILAAKSLNYGLRRVNSKTRYKNFRSEKIPRPPVRTYTSGTSRPRAYKKKFKGIKIRRGQTLRIVGKKGVKPTITYYGPKNGRRIVSIRGI